MAIAPNTPLWTKLGFDEGKHASAGKWPRMTHMQGHLDVMRGKRTVTFVDTDRALLPLLLEPHTLGTIAEWMGDGWSESYVTFRAQRIGRRFGFDGYTSHIRLALIAIAAGVNPCVCE